MGCSCKETTGGSYLDDCPYLTASYILAGLSMMLNIRLAYSSAPYALIRFRLPENLFSVFVRRMASALELWCLPSMLLGNIIEMAQRLSAKPKDDFKLDHSKQQTQGTENTKLGRLIKMKYWKYHWIIVPSIMTMWSDFITYVILLIIYVIGGDTGRVTAYYGVIAVSGFIFGINMTLVYAADWRYIPVYIAGENAFPMLTSIIHYFTTLILGNRRKYNSDFLIVCIDISVAIIISLTTAIIWTYSYNMDHGEGNHNKFKFSTSQSWSAYDTTRNTSVTFDVNLNGGGSNNFRSNGTITITVGADNFTQLTGDVTITLSGGTIRKYKDKDKLPTEDNLEEIKGTDEKLNKGDVLYIQAKGEISSPQCEVTIKGTLDVTSSGNLSTALTLAADTKYPSSTGLGGSITPKSTGTGPVQISSGDIELKDKALKALLSLIKNVVTLSGSSGGFRSSASITVTRTSGTVNFKSLPSSNGVTITISEGTIKNSDGTDLQKSTPLTVGTQLSLEANGSLSAGSTTVNAPVKLTGTIVVTNKNEQTLGTNPLKFGGGPNREGVTGSLSLDDNATATPNHVKITASSKIEIKSNAYGAIQKASDTTPSSFTIGAADPRDIGTHTSDIEAGTGTDYKYLATESSFQIYWHLLPSERYDKNDLPYPDVASPTLMVIVGMGLVYAIYPGISPGMIVPFYLVDKIETVLLVLTTFPPVIIALLRKYQPNLSPQYNHFGSFKSWTEYEAGQFYLGLSIIMVIKISLAVIFIYSLHYRDSSIARSIINQPKMSTFLTITFYMCHEFLLALGFSGVIGNNGATYVVLPAQYVGALFMIFLAFYSEGYIIEYKSHDPAHWPTEGMTKWNAFCYWCKRASKITNHNLRSLFTTDLRRDLLLCIQKNELI